MLHRQDRDVIGVSQPLKPIRHNAAFAFAPERSFFRGQRRSDAVTRRSCAIRTMIRYLEATGGMLHHTETKQKLPGKLLLERQIKQGERLALGRP